MRRRILVICIVIGVLLIACANVVRSSNATNTALENTQDVTQWRTKAPQLFSNTGYSKLVESSIKTNYQANNKNGYIGEVTNPFGIRDDVLEFIINYFPKNESAVYAAIRVEQYDVLIFRSKTDKEAVNYANADSVPIWCLAKSAGFISADKYLDDIGRIKLSTPEGKKIDKKSRIKLGWKVFGTGSKTKEQLDQLCNNGEY